MPIYLDLAYNFVEKELLKNNTYSTGFKKDKEKVLSVIEFLRHLYNKKELPKCIFVLNFDKFLCNFSEDEKLIRFVISCFNRYALVAEKIKPVVVFPVDEFTQGPISTVEVKVGRKTFDLSLIFHNRLTHKDLGWKKCTYKIS